MPKKDRNKNKSGIEDSDPNINGKSDEYADERVHEQISNSTGRENNEKSKKRKRNASKSDNAPSEEALESGENGTSKKKSKKKKKPENESSVPESKMSKRELKREKHAQRVAEAQEASHKNVQMQALSYLSLWKYNKAEWKFSKAKQIWLYKHKFESDKIPDELWQPYIEYFTSATGGIKKMVIDDCQKLIEEMEKWIEKNEEGGNSDSKPSEISYRRARDLLQNIT